MPYIWLGKNTLAIKEYIQNQIKKNLEDNQMSLGEYIDPFRGEQVVLTKKIIGLHIGIFKL